MHVTLFLAVLRMRSSSLHYFTEHVVSSWHLHSALDYTCFVPLSLCVLLHICVMLVGRDLKSEEKVWPCGLCDNSLRVCT